MTELIISRKEATAQDLKFYFTGKVCKHGHIAERHTRTRDCKICLTKRCMSHNKKWQEANPDIYKERCRKKHKLYKERYGEQIRARQKLYRQEHKEDLRLREQLKYKLNKEKMNAQTRKWREINKEQKRAHHRNRRARKINAGGKHTSTEVKNLYDKQKGRCIYCLTNIVLIPKQRNTYHADHIIAIVRGGTNDITNIQLLCGSCNMRKHAKDPFEFARENGMLIL